MAIYLLNKMTAEIIMQSCAVVSTHTTHTTRHMNE